MSVYGSGSSGDSASSSSGAYGYAPVPLPPKVRFELIGESWNLLTRQLGTWLVAGLAFVLPVLVLVGIFYAVMFTQILAISAPGRSAPDPAEMLGFQARVYGLALPMGILVSALQAVVVGGIVRMVLRQHRGEMVVAGDVLKIGDVAGQLLVVGILQGLAVQIGTMFCYVPGFLLGGLLLLAVPLVVERRLSAVEALRESARLLKPDMVNAALFYFVITLLYGLGAMVCGIGVAFTFPLLPIALALVYRDFFLGGTPAGYPGAPSTGAANPWTAGQMPPPQTPPSSPDR
ncbi:MAG: hypothetical protein H7Z41_06705 [Cytophagales bacterium]|nr:hypothetical protein [Armatimonadota bacterium]